MKVAVFIHFRTDDVIGKIPRHGLWNRSRAPYQINGWRVPSNRDSRGHEVDFSGGILVFMSNRPIAVRQKGGVRYRT